MENGAKIIKLRTEIRRKRIGLRADDDNTTSSSTTETTTTDETTTPPNGTTESTTESTTQTTTPQPYLPYKDKVWEHYRIPKLYTQAHLQLHDKKIPCTGCPRVYYPVCSKTDRRTYLNACVARCANQVVRRDGPCINYYRRSNNNLINTYKVVMPTAWRHCFQGRNVTYCGSDQPILMNEPKKATNSTDDIKLL